MSAAETTADEVTPSELSLLKFLVPGAVQFNCYRDSLTAIRQHTAATVAWERKKLLAEMDGMERELNAAHSATRELREDKELLDWLDANRWVADHFGKYQFVRAAIYAARKAAP